MTFPSRDECKERAAAVLSSNAASGPDRSLLREIVENGFADEEVDIYPLRMEALGEEIRVREILQSHGRLFA